MTTPPGAEAIGDASLLARLTSDHHRLDACLAAGIAAVELGHWGAATDPLGEFALGMVAEMTLEENVLFPAFVAAGGAAAVVASLRAEHALLRDAASELLAAHRAHDAAALHGAHDRLMSVLTYHELKEERGVFAVLDRCLDRAARQELLAKVAATLG